MTMVTLTRPENIPYFFINGLKDKDILEDIDNVCSYEVQEVERVLAGMQDKENAAARLEGRQPKPVEWDGKIRLLKRSKNGNYYFPFGLVDRVIRVLRIYGTDFAVNDGRSRCQSIPEVGSCGEIELRPYQRDALTKLVSNCYNASGIISLPTGAGKCHGIGTPILMFNGEIKPVEDVKVGEFLMGPDSKPRRVLSLARGTDDMYRIVPKKGESWTCNKSHILSLKITSNNAPYKKDQIVNISVEDYLNSTKWFKHISKLWRTGVDYPEAPVEFDPYMIGVWFGDGTKKVPCITNCDSEVVDNFQRFAIENELEIREEPGNNTIMYHFKSSVIAGIPGKNKFRNFIKTCLNGKERSIPREYLINSREVRLQVLAGLLDTDGYYNHNGYEIVTKDSLLCQDILFLARSLGFAAYSSLKTGKIKSTGFEGVYHRITINGHTDEIPCKVIRKQASVRKQKKNVLKTGFSVEYIGKGDYYGFELDSDGLYLLGDFTATHNTVIALFWARMVKGPFWVLVHRKELLDQWHDEIKRLYPGIEVARIGAGYDEKPAFATVAMVQTLANVVKDGKQKFETDLLIMDECHVIPAKNAYSVGMAFQAKYRLGLSATPYRTDGEDLKIFACCGEKASVVTVEDLVSGGHITRPTFIMAKIPAADLPHYSSWSNVVRHGITANASRNQAIEDMARKYLKEGRQVYIHVNQIMHGQGLKRRLEDVGAEWVCGSTPKKERTRIIEDYKAGKIPCLVSTLLKEGVSIDGISCLIYAAGGKSEVATIQTIGRALRKDPKFDDAIIIDFMDKGHKYLEEHREQRIATYRTVYGLLFEY